jgi:hypothetical protein
LGVGEEDKSKALLIFFVLLVMKFSQLRGRVEMIGGKSLFLEEESSEVLVGFESDGVTCLLLEVFLLLYAIAFFG